MYGNPNIRPMYATAGVRPIYNVNTASNPMNVVRPIIINGVQVGTYTRPANPMNVRPGNPVAPTSSAEGTERKRKVEVLDEAKKREV